MNLYVHRSGELIFTHGLNQHMAVSDEYTDHHHPVYEMFFFMDGDIEYVVEGRRYELRPYDLLLIRPGEHHCFRIRSGRQYERMVVFFTDQCVPEAVAPLLREKGSLYHIGDTGLVELFRRIDDHAANYAGEVLSVLLKSCFDELIVKFACLDREVIQTQRLHTGISAVAEYIDENLGSQLTIDDLCRRFGVSRSYLFKAFTERYHEPPKQYIIRRKIMLAQQLLESGERPLSVSERCGFSDYSTFYRAYVRIVGMPPSGHSRDSE